jgi:hypothetical protein
MARHRGRPAQHRSAVPTRRPPAAARAHVPLRRTLRSELEPHVDRAGRRRSAGSPAARRACGPGSLHRARRRQRRGRPAGAAAHDGGRHAAGDRSGSRHAPAGLDSSRRGPCQPRRCRRHGALQRLRVAGGRAAAVWPDEPHRLATAGDPDVPGRLLSVERASGPDASGPPAARRPPPGTCASATTMAVLRSNSPITW